MDGFDQYTRMMSMMHDDEDDAPSAQVAVAGEDPNELVLVKLRFSESCAGSGWVYGYRKRCEVEPGQEIVENMGGPARDWGEMLSDENCRGPAKGRVWRETEYPLYSPAQKKRGMRCILPGNPEDKKAMLRNLAEKAYPGANLEVELG